MKKNAILLSLPILTLAVWVAWLTVRVLTGVSVALPVTGYDPRDILAGQYVSLRVDYSGFPNDCALKNTENTRRSDYLNFRKDAYFCLDSSQVMIGTPDNGCKNFIKGRCAWGTFEDGATRFYVPERAGKPLEQAIRDKNNNPSLLLSVTKDGTAYPRDLLLNGRSWREFKAVEKEYPIRSSSSDL